MENVSTVWDVAAGALPDGRSFFAGAYHVRQLVHRWDAVTGNPLSAPLVGHKGCVMAVAVVPGSPPLAQAAKIRAILNGHHVCAA